MERIIRAIIVLIRVAYITLLERKVLSYSQNRIGPNKVIFTGIIQPILDGVKLLFKELLLMYKRNQLIFLLTPYLSILTILLFWSLIPTHFSRIRNRLSFLLIIVLIGVSVFRTLLSGWMSNRKYRIIGAIRSCSQSISYEVSLSLVIFTISIVLSRFNIRANFYYNFRPLLINLPIIPIWLISIVAECHRAPLDFAEGESELVSGFNVEYSRGSFALIFVSEYGIIIYFSLISSIIFIQVITWFILPFTIIFINFILIIRASFPRIRYDKLMYLAWVKLLPIRILIFILLLVSL